MSALLFLVAALAAAQNATILDEKLPFEYFPPIPGIEEIFGQSGFVPAPTPRPSIHPTPLPPPQPPLAPTTFIVTPTDLPAGVVCVPEGTCNPSNVFDIRIITPGNANPCPPGQVSCSQTGGTGSNDQCGIRYVSASAEDGLATAGSYPWHVYMVNQTGYAGGGVLLDASNVLTAAHKVYQNAGAPDIIGIHVGMYTSSVLGPRYPVDRVLLHPNFDPSNLFNDLAILHLAAPVAPLPQQNVNTACLPTQGQSFVGQNCWLSGWGNTAFNYNDAPTRVQKQVQLPIVSYSACYQSMSSPTVLGANANKYLDPVGELCAGGQATRDACTQDGGSPLVCSTNGRFVVAGLVLWGKGCGNPGVYGVYVNVANYAAWIANSISVLNG